MARMRSPVRCLTSTRDLPTPVARGSRDSVRAEMRALIVLGLAAVLAVRSAPAAAECTLRGSTNEPCLSPWTDEGAALPIAPAPPPPDHRVRAMATVGGLYLGFSAWTYFAWYRNVPSLGDFEWGHDGFFGRNTYAGGADKLGHAWATMVLSRATTGVLRWGGWGQTSSAIAGSALGWALFLSVEIKDGFYYRFSPGDALMNTAGAVMSALLTTQPRLDALVDFRVAYSPSDEYIGLWRGEYYGSKKGNSLNIAEDYSGETYFLALHLGALPRPRATPRWVALALDYVDLGLAFETRKYKPDAPPDAVPTQTLYLGATINLQRVLDRALGRRAPGVRGVGNAILEVLAPPYTIAPVVGVRRAASGPAPEQ